MQESEFIDYVPKKLDLSKNEFNEIMNSKNHTYKDYPSYDFIFGKLTKIARPILSLIFLHKPQSMFKADIIDNK